MRTMISSFTEIFMNFNVLELERNESDKVDALLGLLNQLILEA